MLQMRSTEQVTRHAWMFAGYQTQTAMSGHLMVTSLHGQYFLINVRQTEHFLGQKYRIMLIKQHQYMNIQMYT